MTTLAEKLGLGQGDSPVLNQYLSERGHMKRRLEEMVHDDHQMALEAYYVMWSQFVDRNHAYMMISALDPETECIRGAVGLSRSSFVERYDLPADSIHEPKPFGAWMDEVAGFRDQAGVNMPEFYSELYDFILDRHENWTD